MYTLFNSDSNQEKISVVIPKFNSVKKIINEDIQKVMDYYREYNYQISHTHLIVRILSILNVSFSRSIPDYINTAIERTPIIARLLKLIYPTNDKVETHNGTFYNEHITEYIIASDDNFDVDYVTKHWGFVSPVKIHTHPFTDFSYGFANSKYNSQSETGVAVISVNIPMIALQWRLFNRLFKDNSNFYIKANAFAIRYVMLNTLRNHMEHTVINRFMAYYLQKPVSPFLKNHSIFVNDITSKLDEAILQMVETVEKKKVNINQVFTMFPTLYFPAWSSVIRMPDIVTTQYNKWIFLVAYLPYIELYLAMVKNKDIRSDRDTLFTIRRQLKYLENQRGLMIPLDRTSAMKYSNIKSMLVDLTA